MKKIVDGKSYDTEKAQFICSYEFGNPTDFNFIDESLYVTSSGSYFLAGEGGANTKYRQNVATNEWSGGESIQPMNRDDAFTWAMGHADVSVIEEFFSDLITDA